VVASRQPSQGDAVQHIRPGMRLPHVRLPATDGSEICLAELQERSILIVYPWTGRPGLPNPPDWDLIQGAHGSTPELEGFRDRAEDFARECVWLYAISRQTTDYQREMAARLKLPFPILSDAEGKFAAALGLPCFATGGETYLTRLTLPIDSGRIETLFYPVPEPATHAGDVLRWLKADKTPADPLA
jgi:peroxiredoxin